MESYNIDIILVSVYWIPIKEDIPLSCFSIHLEKLPEFSETILRHNVLEDKLSDETCGNNVRKHLLQNASLLGHLEQAGLVQDDTCFIEFGAGKGLFQLWQNFFYLDEEISFLSLKRFIAISNEAQ